jgi:hypothetical protein
MEPADDADMTTTQRFVKGRDLCERFFREAAQPIIHRVLDASQYSAGLIGWGSDVLGYDDRYSIDHMWGPRFLLFFEESSFEQQKLEIDALLRAHLPISFHGFPTNYGTSPKGDCLAMRETTSPPINHLIEFHCLRSFLHSYLGVEKTQQLNAHSFLDIEEHRLLAVTTGAVFHDGLDVLERMRHDLAFYPDDAWCFLMSRRWDDIAEEEAFVGRCGESGDDIGSRLVTTRLVETVMRLAFLQERHYAPYSKWFSRAFSELKCADTLGPLLNRVLSAPEWRERDEAMAEVYTYVGRMHNELGLSAPLSIEITPAYDGRPGTCVHAERFADALMSLVKDKNLGNNGQSARGGA